MFKSWFKRSEGDSPPAPTPTPPEIPAALAPARRDCWFPVVQAGDDDGVGSKFGGRPLLPNGSEWPACGNCHKPLALLLQLSAVDLPSEAGRPFGEGTLQVFYCLSEQPLCEVDAEAYFAFSTATLVRVLPSGVPLSPAPATAKPAFHSGRITAWRRADDYPNAEEQQALGIHLPDPVLESLDDYPRPGAKLGGWPHWVQGLEYPSCRVCSQRMAYVFQIDSNDHIPYMFGDAGCGHVFQCGQHPEEATFGWACS